MAGGERKCYYKRNKSEDRVFRPCDAARIAKNVNDRSDYVEDEVIRCVAKRLGYFAVALSSKDDQPDDKLTDLIEKAEKGIRSVKKVVETIRDGLDAIIDPIDEFLTLFDEFEEVTDNAKTILGKLFNKLLGRVGSKKRKIKAAVTVIKKIKEKLEDFADQIQDLINTFDRIIDLAAKLNSVRNAKVYLLSDEIKDCKCGDKQNG